jgi:Toxin co-regulated pilus biosynthesis protein Q
MWACKLICTSRKNWKQLVLLTFFGVGLSVQASGQWSYGSPAFLGLKFTGSGHEVLGAAIKKLVPQDIKVLFMDVDPNLSIQWNYADAYVLTVLTDFSKKYHFNWEMVDNKLLILGQGESASLKITDPLRDEGSISSAHQPPVRSKSDPEPFNEVGLAFKRPKSLPENNSSLNFEIRLEDESLSLALRRWSIENGYQLVWDVEKDFPAIQTRYNAKSFLDAFGNVMRDVAKTNYPLHSCVYSNRVVRVLPIAISCERSSSQEALGEN